MSSKLAVVEVPRRRFLRNLGTVLALAPVVEFLACAAGDSTATPAAGDGGSGSDGSGTDSGGSTSSSCSNIPDETAGPYPDKTGMISNSKFFRRDITEGKSGLPLTLVFTVVNTKSACSPVSNATVEIWHCDKDGVYSEYGGQPGVADQTGTTFLRGLQSTDSSGKVSFTTIYPGWYAGRVTHVHIQVFVNGSTVAAKTTQLAFPDSVNSAVYGQNALYVKGQNSLVDATDMVFSDGDTYELGSLSGDPQSGYTATLTIGLAV